MTREVVAWARTDPRVLAIVGVGSTAGASRGPDLWSDHDLVVVTPDPTTAAALRASTDWLPASVQTAIVFSEPDHGLTILDKDGHLMEFAVAAHDDLTWLAADDVKVLYADPACPLAVEAAITNSRPSVIQRTADPRVRFVKEVVIAIGRAARGETLSSRQHIAQAVAHLLEAAADDLPLGSRADLDPMDPHRRIEQIRPELAAPIEQAMRLPPLDTIEALLGLATEPGDGGRPTLDTELLTPAHAALARARGITGD